MAHAARVLSEDSPAAPAVEQGRVTVSDASRVIDEPTEVQLRALERVTGGGSRNLAGAAQGAAPGGGLRRWPRLSAVLGRPHGGSGKRRHEGSHQPARTWGEVRRWWCQVRTSALVTLGVGWGLLGAEYRLRPAAVAEVGSVARGGRRHPDPARNSSQGRLRATESRLYDFPALFSPTVGDNNAAENGFPGLELRARGPGGLIVPGGWRF